MLLIEQLQKMLNDETLRSSRVEESAQRTIALQRLANVDRLRRLAATATETNRDEVEALELELLEIELILGMG